MGALFKNEINYSGGGGGGGKIPSNVVYFNDEQSEETPFEEKDITIYLSDLDYLEEEQLTGKRWVDGKPIYQNIYRIDSSISSATNIYSKITNLSEIDNIINALGIRTTDNPNGGSKTPCCIPVEAWIESSSSFKVYSNTLWNSVPYLILQYTKKTDTSSSPIKPIQIEKKHNYSTNEKVIGTWINGKPLYEKTWYVENLPTGSLEYFSNVIVEDAEDYFIENVFGKNSGSYQGVGITNNNNIYDTCITSLNLTNGRWWLIRGGSSTSSIYITMRYTKTTD